MTQHGSWLAAFVIIACGSALPASAVEPATEAGVGPAPLALPLPDAVADAITDRRAEEPSPQKDAPTAAAAPSPEEEDAEYEKRRRTSWRIIVDPDTFALTSDTKGLSLYKPMYLLPATYSGRYPGSSSEVLFGLSVKLRLFEYPIFFAYSQKSFFQAFNGTDSKPFRDNNFNPEVFYRFKPKNRSRWLHLGADLGLEHESNGRDLPDSRSWNRLYFAPFYERQNTLVYWKWWYRLPEDQKRAISDPKRDDNPDIQDYYGYTELQLQQRLFGRHQASTLMRYNPTTGRGAVGLRYSVPGPGDNFFWTFYVWQGYGESLLDYDRSITRVGLGISVAR